MNTLAKLISALIHTANKSGLDSLDVEVAKDFLNNREYGLAFDTVVTQLYENEIDIDEKSYSLIEVIAQKMEMSEDKYCFMRELIRAGK